MTNVTIMSHHIWTLFIHYTHNVNKQILYYYHIKHVHLFVYRLCKHNCISTQRNIICNTYKPMWGQFNRLTLQTNFNGTIIVNNTKQSNQCYTALKDTKTYTAVLKIAQMTYFIFTHLHTTWPQDGLQWFTLNFSDSTNQWSNESCDWGEQEFPTLINVQHLVSTPGMIVELSRNGTVTSPNCKHTSWTLKCCICTELSMSILNVKKVKQSL